MVMTGGWLIIATLTEIILGVFQAAESPRQGSSTDAAYETYQAIDVRPTFFPKCFEMLRQS